MQSTSLNHKHIRQSHRISSIVLTSFSLLTLLVLLVTFFSWRELKHQQGLLATFTHSALPQAQKTTESHAIIQQMATLTRNLAATSSPKDFAKANSALHKLVETRLATILATSPDSHEAMHSLLGNLSQLTQLVKERTAIAQTLRDQRANLSALHGQWLAGISSLPNELSQEEKKLFMAIPQQFLAMSALNNPTPVMAGTVPSTHGQANDISSIPQIPQIPQVPQTPQTTEKADNGPGKAPGKTTGNPPGNTAGDNAPASRDLLFSHTQTNLEHIKKIVSKLPDPAQKSWSSLVGQTDKAIFGGNGYAQTLLSEEALMDTIVTALGETAHALRQLDSLVHTSGIASLHAIHTTAENTETSLKIFSRFFILASILAIFVASLTIIFYYKTFYKRIKQLQEYLSLSAKGHPAQLETEGNDEVSGLAHAIESYVAETDRAIELVEASSKSKSDFLVSINHEIRTPLNAIIGYTRMTNETALSAIQKSYLDKIVQATHYLLGIMNTMLNFSKVEADTVILEVAPFNLQESLDSATSFARSKASGKGLAFEVITGSALPPVVHGDALRLSQIINNLTNNAVNYTHSGKITVSAEPVRTEDSTVHIKFTVADEGIGMTKEQVDALVAPSTATDDYSQLSFSGTTGLGLSISKALCSLMGGTLMVESAPGQGSTFSFTLPFEFNAEAFASESMDNTVPDLSGRAILLAEDNLINQEIALALLEKTHASVTIANNGLEATDLAQANHYDLILMDIKMPMMSGIAATKNIIEYHRNGQVPPIIAMTANAMDEDRQQSLDAGMKDYITKPIEAIVFYQMLRKWCLSGNDEKHK